MEASPAATKSKIRKSRARSTRRTGSRERSMSVRSSARSSETSRSASRGGSVCPTLRSRAASACCVQPNRVNQDTIPSQSPSDRATRMMSRVLASADAGSRSCASIIAWSRRSSARSQASGIRGSSCRIGSRPQSPFGLPRRGPAANSRVAFSAGASASSSARSSSAQPSTSSSTDSSSSIRSRSPGWEME